MVLALPGRVLTLSAHLGDAYPDELADADRSGAGRLLARFEPVPPAPDDCGARDWSDFNQRMHYIVHLFRVFHSTEQLSEPPFTAGQIASIGHGHIPGGQL